MANAITLAISSVIKIGLILNEAPLIAFAAMVIFDSIVLSLGLIYFYLKQLGRGSELSAVQEKRYQCGKILSFKFSRTMAIELLKASWPLILSGLVISVYMKIDQIMIKEMIDVEAVGQYAAAVRISEAWYFIPMVIVSSLFPAIINAKKISKNLYHSRLQNLYDLMVWMAIIIALPMTFWNDWIVNFLYGKEYSQAGNILMIHIWAGVFVFLGVANGKRLLSENLQIFSTINTTIGAVVNVFLNYILIKKYGISGAAWATLVSYFVAAYLSLILNKKTRKSFVDLTKSIFFIRMFNVKKNN